MPSRNHWPVPTLLPHELAPIWLPMASTTYSTARRCGSPTVAQPICSPCSPKSEAKSSPPSSWSELSPVSAAAPKNIRWESRQRLPLRFISITSAVPVGNLLGEIGRGHVIAFNMLNIGRLKLGFASVGAAKNVLAISIKYAKQRKAFGSAIADFGAIQHKLAEMAIRIFAAESMTWRVAGLIESQMQASAERRQGSIRARCRPLRSTRRNARW